LGIKNNDSLAKNGLSLFFMHTNAEKNYASGAAYVLCT